MAIYIMNGKTFKKTFLKENPKKILDAQYVLVSSRIRRNGSSERRNIINMSKQLMPSDCILADWRMDSDEYYFQDQYSKQVKGNLALLAIIVKGVIEEKYTVVFLCSKNEWKLKYLQFIANAIENYFGYPVYNYKKLKEGKIKSKSYNKDFVISQCDKYIAKERKKRRKKLMSTKRGRKTLVNDMSKDEMIRELKRLGLYTSDMTKKEMKDLLDYFFVDR